MPPGPAVISCVVAPLPASIDSSNARPELATAISTAMMVATPSDNPSSARASCAGWRRRGRTLAAHNVLIVWCARVACGACRGDVACGQRGSYRAGLGLDEPPLAHLERPISRSGQRAIVRHHQQRGATLAHESHD